MQNNNLLILGGIAAFFLLGGADALGGGVSGGGGSKESKSTAITGITPEQPGYSDPISKKEETATTPIVTQPFQPSQYLMDLISQKASAESIGLSPLSKKETEKLWSSNPSVSNVLSDIKQQGATVYTAPKINDARMIDYYVEIGGATGLKPASSSSTSSKKSISSGGFTYSSTPTGGTGMAAGSVSRTIGGVKYYR